MDGLLSGLLIYDRLLDLQVWVPSEGDYAGHILIRPNNGPWRDRGPASEADIAEIRRRAAKPVVVGRCRGGNR